MDNDLGYYFTLAREHMQYCNKFYKQGNYEDAIKQLNIAKSLLDKAIDYVVYEAKQHDSMVSGYSVIDE